MPCSDDKIPCPFRDLDFETLLADPLTRLVMASDGVTESAMRALLEQTAAARAREIVPPVAGDPPPG